MRILALAVIILALVSSCATTKAAEPNYGRLTIHNCVPDTWVGGIKWNKDKTDYVDVPEAEIKHHGWLDADLEVGTYGFTHFRPSLLTLRGFRPAAILQFMDDVKIEKNKQIFIEFGCE